MRRCNSISSAVENWVSNNLGSLSVTSCWPASSVCRSFCPCRHARTPWRRPLALASYRARATWRDLPGSRTYPRIHAGLAMSRASERSELLERIDRAADRHVISLRRGDDRLIVGDVGGLDRRRERRGGAAGVLGSDRASDCALQCAFGDRHRLHMGGALRLACLRNDLGRVGRGLGILLELVVLHCRVGIRLVVRFAAMGFLCHGSLLERVEVFAPSARRDLGVDDLAGATARLDEVDALVATLVWIHRRRSIARLGRGHLAALSAGLHDVDHPRRAPRNCLASLSLAMQARSFWSRRCR